MNTVSSTPADRLEGHVLSSGWKITQKLIRKKGATGGSFGVIYLAARDGEIAFVKALDFRSAFGQPNFIEVLNALTSHVLWERELMEFCKGSSMSRVVRLLDYEDFVLPEDGDDQTMKVCCFVLEVGEGDLRSKFNESNQPRHSWKLRVLRDVALALDQLHRKGIAHLDVKPSNVIALVDERTGGFMKLADLGRSVRKGFNGPFDGLTWPGDRAYAPPEKWYGYRSGQWQDEREAADLYLLGSLFVYLYTSVPLNPLLIQEVPEQFYPENHSTFDPSLIDVLTQAQARVLALDVFPELPETARSELETMILEMTMPDPAVRGDRKARRQGVIGIDRYHQKLQRIARRVEIEERRSAS